MKNRVLQGTKTGLAGALAIAGGTQAYGAVVSTTLPANFVPTSGVTNPIHSTLWDVNGDGTTDFGFGFYQKATSGNFVSGIYGIGGAGVNAAVGTYGTYGFYVSNLAPGTTVGSASMFGQNTGYYSVLASRFSGTFYGNFVNTTTGAAQTGFIGFEFTAADGIHFGAVQVTTSAYKGVNNKGGQTFGVAEYETVAGVPLVITATPGAVPEPTSLAALAFGVAGATGVALRRRQKASSVTLPA